MKRRAPLPYDFFVLATGAAHSYFGHPQWSHPAPGLKTLADALRIRNRFLATFEKAEREEDPETQRALLTFVIVGAGATGVELAGTLQEMGRFAARAILATLDHKPRGRFRYRDRGSMATIGRGAAVAQLGGLRFSGYPAWLLWLFVHLMLLVDFRNRVFVLLPWCWAYVTAQRRARLIVK